MTSNTSITRELSVAKMCQEHDRRLVVHDHSLDPYKAASDLATCILDSNLQERSRIMMIVPLVLHKSMSQDFYDKGITALSAKNEECISICTTIALVHPQVIHKIVSKTPMKWFDTLIVCDGRLLKNHRAKMYLALYGKIRQFKRVYCFMTPDIGFVNLWGPVKLLDNEILGKYRNQFLNDHFKPGGYMNKEWLPRADTEKGIRAKLDPITEWVTL